MRTVSVEQIAELQKKPQNIRNVCILAHVDHGKTTLADALVASNGIISSRMAGKLRYMDSRKDEQERGITMKSSSISLHFQKDDTDFLINLIDSPGHVDFTGEVATAVRLCDGAIVVVDVIEGVCAQTKVALRLTFTEHLKPVLVLNKIDRLILERKLTPLDAYIHLQQILEQVNAVIGELFTAEVLGKSAHENFPEGASPTRPEKQVFDWSSGLEEADDSSVYFSPDQGNVIFTSAYDGWGFSVSDFSQLCCSKLGVSKEVLQHSLWGDFYFSTKAKKIMKGAQAKAKKPLFVQLVLENIWSVYESVCVRRDKPMIEKIVKSLNLQLSAQDARHSDARVQLQALCSQWLPLANAVLEMCCSHVPNPCQLTEDRVEGLLCTRLQRFDSLPSETQSLKKDFLACSLSESAPVIVCISKMFAVEKKHLPENRFKPLSPEEIALRREQAKQRHAERLASKAAGESEEVSSNPEVTPTTEVKALPVEEDSAVFIAFARVFSGVVKKGQTLFVLGPKHDPATVLNQGKEISASLTLKDLKADEHATRATVSQVYLLMGRELEALNEAHAGNIVGIQGLEDHVLKTATLSSTIACPPFVDFRSPVVPILRVALEPANLSEMPLLIQGMKLLNQADPYVQVILQETGEHVLVTAGEMHLERCLDDLKEKFAKIDINVSAPIVPFRETIVQPPKVDRVNEAIEDTKQILKSRKGKENEEDVLPDGTVVIHTSNKQAIIHIKAVPLPEDVTSLLEKHSSLIKDQDQTLSSMKQADASEKQIFKQELLQAVQEFRNKLEEAFKASGTEWEGIADCIWSFGPRRCGSNILVNKIKGYKRQSVWLDCQQTHIAKSALTDHDNNFISGFQLATLSGPVCEEPMMGVCFVVNRCDIDSVQLQTSNVSDSGDHERTDCGAVGYVPYGPFSGQIMSTVKEGCRKAFQVQPQRLMAAMYSCNIQVTADALRKMYAVLGRRHGRVLGGDMQEGSQTFDVTAVLPVIESFDFANEIRKQTSGLASPQLLFSHWEVIDIDPYWVPTTEEEYMHFGEKADSENRARKYMNSVRRRKGLPVDVNIVEHAEKQRTLSRKK